MKSSCARRKGVGGKMKIRAEESLSQDKLIRLAMEQLQERIKGGEGPQELVLEIGETGAGPESYSIVGDDSWSRVTGADEKGLAYGIQDLAERLGDAVFAKGYVGKPETALRGVDKFIMNTEDESWWMNPEYWEDFISALARFRYNRLAFVAGFDTEYLTPPYPFFVDVEGFEDVTVDGKVDRKRNLDALRMIGRICHEYHLEFSFAIWQQQPWQREDRQLVKGLEKQERLEAYCSKGIKALLRACPETDNVHFRVNHESGVGGRDSAEAYWLAQIDAVGEAAREAAEGGRRLTLELRAKGMTDQMAERALEDGLELTVSTKYCCEHAGLPYHLSQMRGQELADLSNLNMARRYSYADMLKRPHGYDMVYRLWFNGSMDLFTWADPEYVRKFVRSMQVGDAKGFELMPPLTLKGGREFEKHAGWKLFSDADYQPPKWEDERYWQFYMMFGRLGYDSNYGGEAWKTERRNRLGENAELAGHLTELSSKVMPFITSFHFTEHPQLCYWPELSTGAALFVENNYHPNFRAERDTYQDSLPCDEGLFYSIANYVKARGKTDGKYTPGQIYNWLDRLGRKLKAYLDAAQGLEGGWEWKGIVLDARMLYELCCFHKNKLVAAWGLSYFLYENKDAYLQEAADRMKDAKGCWERLADLGTAYHENLMFAAGPNCMRRGTWKDYLPEIERDLAKLEELAGAAKAKQDSVLYAVRQKSPAMRDSLPDKHMAGQPLSVVVWCDTNQVQRLVMKYRRTNQLEGPFHEMEMEKQEDGFTCTLEGSYMTPEWDLLVYFDSVDEQGDAILYPGIDSEQFAMPYKQIRICSKEE